MADSPAHQFGQMIGKQLELAVEPALRTIADHHGLFLDRAGPRPTRSNKKQVRWIDAYGNQHNLDFVLERNGASDRIGTPVAFLETAWRRYTKQSRNKAQELQGAVLPIRDQHRFAAPFLGCILAGEFTSTALEQLRSHGFRVLHFPYQNVVRAFASQGFNAASEEATKDSVLRKRMAAWQRVSQHRRLAIQKQLLDLNAEEVSEFMAKLGAAIGRSITQVLVTMLHGTQENCRGVVEALSYLQSYSTPERSRPLARCEISVRYDNGDRIDAQFGDVAAATEFLTGFRSGQWTPA